jgi:hypothetical protein
LGTSSDPTNPDGISLSEVRVRLLAQDRELYVFVESRDRIAKEGRMRRRQMNQMLTRSSGGRDIL